MSHWVKGDVITAAKLNSMENRTATDVVYWINDNDGTLDKNYEQIESAFLSGMLPIIKHADIETGYWIQTLSAIGIYNNHYFINDYLSDSSTGILRYSSSD